MPSHIKSAESLLLPRPAWRRMVGTERFELSTSCSRSKRSTRLSYVPISDRRTCTRPQSPGRSKQNFEFPPGIFRPAQTVPLQPVWSRKNRGGGGVVAPVAVFARRAHLASRLARNGLMTGFRPPPPNLCSACRRNPVPCLFRPVKKHCCHERFRCALIASPRGQETARILPPRGP